MISWATIQYVLMRKVLMKIEKTSIETILEALKLTV